MTLPSNAQGYCLYGLISPHGFLIFRIILYTLENFSNFVRYCRYIAAPLYSDMLVPCAQNPQSPVLRRKTHIYRKSLHPSSDHGASEVFFISKKEMEGNAAKKGTPPGRAFIPPVRRPLSNNSTVLFSVRFPLVFRPPYWLDKFPPGIPYD